MTLYVAAAVPSSPVVAVDPSDHACALHAPEPEQAAVDFECEHCGGTRGL